MTFAKYIKNLQTEIDESSATDVAPVDKKLGKKVKKKIKVQESNTLPTKILRDNNIKVKSSDVDKDNYVIILFKKEDLKPAKQLLEDNDFNVQIIGKMLYVN